MGAASSMQRLSRFSLLAAACALAVAGTLAGTLASAAEPKGDGQSVWVTGTRDPSSWVRAESPHIVLLTDTSSGDAKDLLNGLERLDALLRLYLAPFRKTGPGADPEADARIHFYYLKGSFGFDRFAPGAPARAIGLFNSCVAGVLGVGMQVGPIAPLGDAELARTPLDEGQSYLFEAYARHFLFRHTDLRAPAAVIEGLAMYFSAVRFSAAQMVVGRTPTGVGRYFALLDEGYQHEAEYDDVFARTYVPDPDVNVDARARARQLEIEARGWTLAHYMLSTEDRRARMAGFMDAVHRGEAPAQAFARSYGIAPGKLADTMWHYRLSAKTLQVQLPALETAPVATRVLSRAAGEFVLAEARRASCPAPSEARDLLQAATARAAGMENSAVARAGIARLQVDWGEPEAVAQALPGLRQAAALDPDDADAAYWLGRAELRLAGRDPGRLAAAQAELARASTLRPGEATFALARLQAALAARPEPDRPALDAILAAWRGARDNNTLAREAALADAWTGDPAGALHVLQVLSRDSRDPAAQAWAGDWRARLEKGVAPAALFAEMRRIGQSAPAVKEWTVDQDTVAGDVERKRGFDNARIAIPFEPQNGTNDVGPYWSGH
jgi:hypothetical protein